MATSRKRVHTSQRHQSSVRLPRRATSIRGVPEEDAVMGAPTELQADIPAKLDAAFALASQGPYQVDPQGTHAAADGAGQ